MRAFVVLCFVAVACADQLGYNYQPVAHSDQGLSFAPSRHGAASLSEPIAGPVPQGELEKEYFTFSANDGDFDEPNALDRAAGSLNKGLRVIFIKGPENRGLENAALALAKEAGEQQTAIYVLNKQADIGDLANRLNSVRGNKNSKPEVHFVKYRTPEDAANAQQAIQSQYDQLGGSTHSHNGGVAPVLNFASQAPVHQATPQAPGNAYLPTSIFRHRV